MTKAEGCPGEVGAWGCLLAAAEEPTSPFLILDLAGAFLRDSSGHTSSPENFPGKSHPTSLGLNAVLL